MRRLVIAVDCDDVLVETLPRVVEDYNSQYGTQLTLGHMYNESPDTLTAFGVDTIEEAIARLHDIYRQEGYYLEMPPINGAQGAISKLAEVHELHLVTGRQSFLEDATKQTLQRYFPGMFLSIEHTNYYSDGTNTTKPRSKGEVCMSIGADILIDDHIAHLESVLSVGLSEVILFGDYPWNTTVTLLPKGVRRAKDWTEVLKEVERIASS